ncbi:hypothetical protein GCM10029978_034780 [Actinoallomurus acanthiterrae]
MNMSFYGRDDTLLTSQSTQRLFSGWGVPFVRVPLRDHFGDNGPQLADADWLAAMNAARQVGGKPVLILRGPGGGRSASDILSTNRHLLDLVHQVFGDAMSWRPRAVAPARGDTAWILT